MAIDQIKIGQNTYDVGATAANVSFDNTGTDLEATTSQSAIVEVNTKTSNFAKVASTGEYNDLNHLPIIPSHTSDLINNSNYIDNSVNNLINYYTKNQVNNLIGDLNSNYSTTEVDTGMKWIDNRHIYKIVIPYSSSSDVITINSNMDFSKPENIDFIISGFYIFDGTSGNYGKITQANQIRVKSDVITCYIDNASFSGVPGNTFYLIINYVKVSI